MTEAEKEREAVVRWLRQAAKRFQKNAPYDAGVMEGIAGHIERGDHLQ